MATKKPTITQIKSSLAQVIKVGTVKGQTPTVIANNAFATLKKGGLISAAYCGVSVKNY